MGPLLHVAHVPALRFAAGLRAASPISGPPKDLAGSTWLVSAKPVQAEFEPGRPARRKRRAAMFTDRQMGRRVRSNSIHLTAESCAKRRHCPRYDIFEKMQEEKQYWGNENERKKRTIAHF